MEGTLAEIRMFAGNFAPRGWQLCQGQLLSIAQWTAVFALVGTTYGGDGQTTFGIPDFRSRFAVGTGQGPGLSSYTLGQMAGTESNALTVANLAAHNHPLTGSVSPQANNDGTGATSDPSGRRLAATGTNIFTGATTDLVNMAADASTLAVGNTGSNQPVNNLAPYLSVEFIMCVEGIFPSRD